MMNLQHGNNFFVIGFSLSGTLFEATINVWFFPSNTKFVISDIDGTITKHELGDMFKFSDRLHNDVISTYQEIANNGYVFLYLTARSFTQVFEYTKNC
jgi:phosphatidate phosphatase PAH1